MRVVFGFAFAPLAPLLIALPLALALDRPAMLGPLSFMCIFYGYPLTLVLALPLYVEVSSKQMPGLWLVLGAGAAIGAAVPVVLILCMKLLGLVATLSSEVKDAPGDPWGFLLGCAQVSMAGAAMGVVMALSFWLIALRGQTARPARIRQNGDRQPHSRSSNHMR